LKNIHLSYLVFCEVKFYLVNPHLIKEPLLVLSNFVGCRNRVTHNVLQLGEVADFEALTFNLAQMLI